MSETTFRELMGELAASFMEDARRDGSKFVRLVDGRPDWMRDAVHEAHGDAAPNDRHYQAARDVALYLAECNIERSGDDFSDFDSDVCDACSSAAESLTDVYTSHLIAWLHETPGAIDACDEAAEEGLVDASADMETRIKCGQYRWYEQIGQTLCRVIDGQLSEREASEELAEVAK